MQIGAVLRRRASGQKDADVRGVSRQVLQQAAQRAGVEEFHAARAGAALLHHVKDTVDVLAEGPGGFGRAAVNSEDKLLGLRGHKTFV